jgi:hypothetical protein
MASAMPAPIPFDAPVTIATFPLNLPVFMISPLCAMAAIRYEVISAFNRRAQQ